MYTHPPCSRCLGASVYKIKVFRLRVELHSQTQPFANEKNSTTPLPSFVFACKWVYCCSQYLLSFLQKVVLFKQKELEGRANENIAKHLHFWQKIGLASGIITELQCRTRTPVCSGVYAHVSVRRIATALVDLLSMILTEI